MENKQNNDLIKSPVEPLKKRGRPKGSTKSEGKKERPITRRQQRFIEEYMIDLNGTQAAIRVGYKPNTARTVAADLLALPNIKAAVDKAMKDLSLRTGVTAERVVKELALVGFANMADFINVDDEGIITVKSLDALPEGSSRVIKKVKQKRLRRITPNGKDTIIKENYEFELCEKVKSLELLARHLGILHDKKEHTGKDGGPLTVELVDFVIGGDGKVADTK